jgi:glyceraldehyde 3-phosphate dehydrogenase
MKIGINGTGRIGRLLIRRLFSKQVEFTDIEVVAINSTFPISHLCHLLRYDSVHHVWDVPIEVAQGGIEINGKFIHITSQREPERIPWDKLGVQIVIDATGKFLDRSSATRHLQSGASKVIVTAPGNDLDATIVMGVNEEQFDPMNHCLISTASCTTNCIAPVLSILDQAFGVEQGWMTTIHAYTNDQNTVDNYHNDLRRARTAASSIIPTSTGVSKALAGVLPNLAFKIQGYSVRVPVPNVSLLDLQVKVSQEINTTAVKEAFKHAIQGNLGKFIDYNEQPLVSADYIGNDKSAIIDGLSILVRQDQVKLLAWYDNEWAYACRVVDFVRYIRSQYYALVE